MSKKWKIIWGILGALIVIIIAVVGVVFYFIHGMQVVAQNVYGGTLPRNVISIAGIDTKTNRMAVYMDTKGQVAMVVLLKPGSAQAKKPLSEPDVKKALANYGTDKEIQGLLAGANEGDPATFTLGKKIVHTVKYTAQGKLSEAGVLNLDHDQMLFIATGGITQGDSDNISQFLWEMPTVRNDSHITAASPLK